MQTFVARQPIFDARQRVVAYELSFRSGIEGALPRKADGELPSSRVMRDALALLGLPRLAGGKKIFVGVTRKALCDGLYAVLPARQTVVALAEPAADPETLAAVRAARSAGYDVALDDYVARRARAPLVPLASVLKVDFLATAADERRRIAVSHRQTGVALLAARVETGADLRAAQALGFTLFEGGFFQHPEIVSRHDVPPSKLTCLRLLRALHAPELDLAALERLVAHDRSLSARLLRVLEAAAAGWRSRVTSLRHALVLLGERPFRKWAALAGVVGLADDRPPELALTCLGRARFAEQLCAAPPLAGRDGDAFLMGLASGLDAMMGRPLPELLAEIAGPPDVDAALLGAATPLGLLHRLIVAYERAEWSTVAAIGDHLRIPEDALAIGYASALDWAATTLPR